MNEYEKLIRKGYREEEIDLPLDAVSRISISDNPMGPGREDKDVIVKDSSGVEKKTSSIMMGYNKKGIRLGNGDYVSSEELEQALGKALETEDENVIYTCRKTGKIVEIDDIRDALLDAAMKKAYLSHASTDKITNQQAVSVIVHDKGKEYPKGIAMLGNDKLQLPSGEYVSEQEIQKAIQDYVMLHEPKKEAVIPPAPIPTPPPIVPSREDPILTPPVPKLMPKPEPVGKKIDSKEETYTVIQRIRHKASVIPALISAGVILLSGFGPRDVTEIREYRGYIQDVNVAATQIQYDKEYETPEDVAKRMYGGLITGGQTEVQEGVSYYASSDNKYGGNNQQGIFGEGLRSAGNYNIDSFSIIKDGSIVEVVANEGEDLFSAMQRVAQENSTTIENLQPWIHLGGPVAGWVRVNDLISEEEKTPREIAEHVVLDESNKIEGSIEGFEGDSITIQSQGSDVTLKIKNDEGEFVKEGDVVIGSDGMEYQIDNLTVEKEEIIDSEEIVTGSKLEWSLKNIALAEALSSAALAIAGTYISSKIPRKEKTEMTSSQIDGMIKAERKEFTDAKGEYEGVSEFTKATETLTKKQVIFPNTPNEVLRNSLINQETTVEDITNMYENSTGGKAK